MPLTNNTHPFNIYTSISSQKGKVFFLTGGTGGLGRATLLALARHEPAAICFTGRDMGAALILENEIKSIDSRIRVNFFRCDHSSLASVEAAARQFLTSDLAVPPRLDVLICNAGIMGKDAALTADGFELHFGVNHMAHALLVKMLLPTLENTNRLTGQARMVHVTSVISRLTFPGGIIFDELKSTQESWLMGRWRRYGQSKLANLLYARQLAIRHPGVKCVSVHPGCIKTGLWNTELSLPNRIFATVGPMGQWVSEEEGIANTCWAATTDVTNLADGAFYEWTGIKGKLDKNADNEELGSELWKWTQENLADFGH